MSMFRTRAEVRQSLKESFFTGLAFIGTGVVLTGFLMGAASLYCLAH